MASSTEKLLALEPKIELLFVVSPTSTNQTTLKVTNVHSSYVAFKVKTTAPKSYLVRPSTGNLGPGDTEEVQIILQPAGADSSTSSHRFLVQAVQVSSSEPVSREQWAAFTKEEIQEQRLSVQVAEESAESSSKTTGGKKLPAVSTSSIASSNDGTPDDLKVKYDELVQYTHMLEKERNKLKSEIAAHTSTGGTPARNGYAMIHLFVVAVVVFLTSTYLTRFVG